MIYEFHVCRVKRPRKDRVRYEVLHGSGHFAVGVAHKVKGHATIEAAESELERVKAQFPDDFFIVLFCNGHGREEGSSALLGQWITATGSTVLG